MATVTLLTHARVQSPTKICLASTTALVVLVVRGFTLGDRAFPVAATQFWNASPSDVTTETSL